MTPSAPLIRYPDGELAQVGTDVYDGCALAIGQGLLRASFEPAEPLGISFGPLARLEGRGCEVIEVEPGGLAREDVGELVGLLRGEGVAAGEGRSHL